MSDMKPAIAARGAADAILDAQSGFPSTHRRNSVVTHCIGTERRIATLEAEIEILKAHVAQLINQSS